MEIAAPKVEWRPGSEIPEKVHPDVECSHAFLVAYEFDGEIQIDTGFYQYVHGPCESSEGENPGWHYCANDGDMECEGVLFWAAFRHGYDGTPIWPSPKD